MHDAARRVLHYYPLTLPGTALAAAAVYLLGSAFASGSPHEFLLSITGFLVLLVLAGLGRLQAYRCKLVEFEWDSSAPLAAREHGAQHRLRTRAARSWLFYRIHLRLVWRLQAGRRATLRGYREVATPGGEAAIPLWFPCSGRLELTGRLTIRDVFGLTRAQIRPPERRTLVVRPGLLGEQASPPVEISAGYDTTQRAKTADEEQYFMREYMPGDRMKDINWKATSRLGELITRISPITQEQTQELHVVLRRFRRRGGESLAAVLHLDFIKSWLLTFLRVVKQQHPEFVFVVDSGGESSPGRHAGGDRGPGAPSRGVAPDLRAACRRQRPGARAVHLLDGVRRGSAPLRGAQRRAVRQRVPERSRRTQGRRRRGPLSDEPRRGAAAHLCRRRLAAGPRAAPAGHGPGRRTAAGAA